MNDRSSFEMIATLIVPDVPPSVTTLGLVLGSVLVAGLALLALRAPGEERPRPTAPEPTTSTSLSPWLIALWFGVIAGVGEGVINLYLLNRSDDIVLISPDAPWLAILFHPMLFLVMGLVYTLLARWLPRLRVSNLVATIFSFLAAIAIVSNATEVHAVARAIMALGLAVQTGRLVRKQPAGFARLVMWSFGWTAALRRARARAENRADAPGPDVGRRDLITTGGVVLGALALGIGAESLYGRSNGRVSPRARVSRPTNVVLVVWDTVRAASLSLYGYGRETTPLLESFARDAVTFDRAIAPTSWTLPSHGGMFTGHDAHQLSTSWTRPLSASLDTLSEVLGAAGYRTAGFVANLHYAQESTGLEQGFDLYSTFPRSPGQAVLSTALGRQASEWLWLRERLGFWAPFNRKRGREVVDDFMAWRDANDGAPYFAFLNLFDAHHPYLPPEPYASRFADRKPRSFLPSPSWSEPDQVELLQAAYDGAITYLDDVFATLVDFLAARGDLEDSLVVLVSDHGEEFAEHRFVGHGITLYVPSIHVPLVMRFPNAAHGGRRIDRYVSLRDLPTTIVETLGLDSGPRFPGASLGALIRDRSASTSVPLGELRHRPWMHPETPVSQGTLRSIIVDEMHLIHHLATGKSELYDLADDYWEQRDLAATPDYRERVAELEEMLRREFDS